jgi:hypothetical protein
MKPGDVADVTFEAVKGDSWEGVVVYDANMAQKAHDLNEAIGEALMAHNLYLMSEMPAVECVDEMAKALARVYTKE